MGLAVLVVMKATVRSLDSLRQGGEQSFGVLVTPCAECMVHLLHGASVASYMKPHFSAWHIMGVSWDVSSLFLPAIPSTTALIL